jgi:hypothetical protein
MPAGIAGLDALLLNQAKDPTSVLQSLDAIGLGASTPVSQSLSAVGIPTTPIAAQQDQTQGSVAASYGGTGPGGMPTVDTPSGPTSPNVAVPGSVADKAAQFVQNGGAYGGYQNGQPPQPPPQPPQQPQGQDEGHGIYDQPAPVPQAQDEGKGLYNLPAPAPQQPAPQADQQAPQSSAPVDQFADLSKPSPGSKRGDYYASAVTPQGPMAQIVAAAAQKYGVPLNVATWVGYHESGWNPGATGIPTSSGRAQGMWQFMPGTAKQYGLANPNDPVQSTDAAMHYLSDLATKNGGDWEKAVAQYGTFSTGQGEQQDAAAREGFRQFIGSGGPTLAATQSESVGSPSQGTSLTPEQHQQANELAAVGLPYNPMQAFSPGDKYIAMGMGMMGGHTFADSMKGGLQGWQGERQMEAAAGNQANDLAMRRQQYGLENKRLDQQMSYENAMLGYRNRPQQAGQPVNMGTAEQPQWMQPFKTADGKLVFEPTGAPASNTNANQKPGIASLTNQVKDANEDANQIIDSANEAKTKQPILDAAQSLVASGQGGSGPGLDKVKRDIANYLGVPINGTNPVTSQQLQAAVSQLRGSGIMGKNMRTQREFNTVMEGLANMDQRPEVLGGVLQGLRNINALKIQMGDAWQQLGSSKQQQMRQSPDAMGAWTGQQIDTWSNGVSKKGGIFAQQDPNTGLGFTIH